jgi:hypothetical protein
MFPGLYKSLDRPNTGVPNFQTSPMTNSVLSSVCCSDNTTKSASAPGSRVPFTLCNPSIAAGVAVTALRAFAMDAPEKLRKLLTQSISRIELSTGSVRRRSE